MLENGKKFLGLGCFYLEFSDAIKEDDGERILGYWQYLLPIFKSSGRKNYSIEVLCMLCQFEFEPPPRQAQELIWNRCVSTHNAPGRNIPCDLHQEHLNRIVKDGIRRLNTNKTDNVILKLGKTIGMISPLLDNVKKPSGLHNAPGFSEDLNKITEHLKIFSYRRADHIKLFPIHVTLSIHVIKMHNTLDNQFHL